MPADSEEAIELTESVSHILTHKDALIVAEAGKSNSVNDNSDLAGR